MIKLLESIKMQTNVPLDHNSVVKSTALRDAISSTVRYIGMEVYVSDENKKYRLENGIENFNWTEIKTVAKASELVTDNEHQTVSQTEKDKWDSKADGNHNHNDVYSAKSHTHTADEVSGLPQLPESIKNPHALTIQLNGAGDIVYDGSTVKSLNITPAGIGAQVAGDYALTNHDHEEYQPKGNYALNDHNHDTTYAKTSHSHPEYLSSQGNITVNGNLTVTGEILSNNNVTAYSDIRIKKNIRDIDDEVIEKLKKVRFCNFEYKDCKDDRKRIGVIAQELEELFPELVYENENGIKSVDYVSLNTYFSFAIQKKLLGL